MAIAVTHDDVIKWKYFPRYWPFVRGTHRSPVDSPHKGQSHRALMFSLICGWTSDNKPVIWDAISPIMTSLESCHLSYDCPGTNNNDATLEKLQNMLWEMLWCQHQTPHQYYCRYWYHFCFYFNEDHCERLWPTGNAQRYPIGMLPNSRPAPVMTLDTKVITGSGRLFGTRTNTDLLLIGYSATLEKKILTIFFTKMHLKISFI